MEAVTLHNTGEALTLGGANDVDLLAGFEELNRELLAQLVSVSICSAQFDDVAARRDACLFKVTSQRLGDLARDRSGRSRSERRRSHQCLRCAAG